MNKSLLGAWQFPIVRGVSYSILREKFGLILSELGISETSKCLAVADFSWLYRNASEDSLFDIQIIDDQSKVSIILKVPLSRGCDITKNTFYFTESFLSDSGCNVSFTSRDIYLPSNFNLAHMQQIINTKTEVEKDSDALQTRNSLEVTEERLKDVTKDIEIASHIQQRMLLTPDKLKSIHDQLDCHACVIPFKDIGGDLFHIECLSQDRILAVIGDVSGKGMPAAMMMATCNTLIKAYCETHLKVEEIVGRVNARLVEGNEEDCMFTTLFVVFLDLASNSLHYCNAGHNPAVKITSTGSIDVLDDIHGPAVGVFPDHVYRSSQLVFEPGDRIVLYTDGVSETFNPAGELYGFNRINELCGSMEDSLSSRQFIRRFLHDIQNFANFQIANDDLTFLVIKRLNDSGRGTAVDFGWEGLVSIDAITDIKHSVDRCLSDAHALVQLSVKNKIFLILDEILSNLIRYASVLDEESVVVQFHLKQYGEMFWLQLKDSGPEFDPLNVEDPDISLSLDERELGGLGLYLVRKLSRSVDYSYQDNWNILTLEI